MTVDTQYDKMAEEALKKECSKRGVSDAGDKDDLITRLLQFDQKVSLRFSLYLLLLLCMLRRIFCMSV